MVRIAVEMTAVTDGRRYTMRIAVCDDEEIFLRQAERLLFELAPQYFGETDIESYRDNVRMLQKHEKTPYDIVVMDIQMTPLDGFSAAERLSQMKHACKLIFFSSKEELVFQSFQYEPVYFVRKGSEERMRAELSRALGRIQEKYCERVCLYLTDGEGMMERVPITEIEYVESSRNYLVYRCREGKEYRLRKTMDKEEQSLSRYGFVRIHRAFLVNQSYVVQIKANGSAVKVKSGMVLEAGKNYRSMVLKLFRGERQ